MKTTQKILTTALWALLVVMMVCIIGAGMWTNRRDRDTGLSELDPATTQILTDPPKLAEVPPFALIDQNNQPITRESLRGHPWVAAFVFTHCAGPCPMMTKKMSAMQQAIADPHVHLVSFTVDPERDTPPVLKEYAKQFGADESRWHFLTGDKDAVFNIARGMLISAVPAQADAPIIHSERFCLVDGAGQLRRQYDSNDEQDMKELTADATRLASAAPTIEPARSGP